MNILVPLTITSAMIGAGTTIAEPDVAGGEVAWNAATNYTVGTVAIRTTTHRKYRNAIPGVDAGLPESTPARWLDIGPTNRYAPFDIYTNTATTGTTSFTYVLSPGFFNALSFYGLVGSTLTVTIKDAPGGTVIYTSTTELFVPAAGLYEYLFSPLRQISRVVLKALPISPTAELTVTVAGGTGNPVALGMLNIGNLRSLIASGLFGGTEYGASAEPKSYSYIKYFDDGTTQIVRRGATTDMRGNVFMPAGDATAAVDLVQSVLDVPVSCIATDAAGYDYLNVFGLVSGSAEASGPTHANFSYSVKGFI